MTNNYNQFFTIFFRPQSISFWKRFLGGQFDLAERDHIVWYLHRMGAAVIAAKSCLRSGCGLLTVSVPQDEQFILQTAIPEAMLVIRENDEDNFSRFSAAGIGPGIGLSKVSIQILSWLLTAFNQPIVLDADALNIIAIDNKMIEKVPSNTILTPHTIEFDRLFGIHKSTDERIDKAIEKQKNII